MNQDQLRVWNENYQLAINSGLRDHEAILVADAAVARVQVQTVVAVPPVLAMPPVLDEAPFIPHSLGTGQDHRVQHPSHHLGEPVAGDDLRDFQVIQTSLTGDNPVTDEFGQPVAIATAGMAGRTLRLILGGGGGRLTLAIWNSLPSIVRTALTQLGIGIGAMVAFNGDIPFITLPGQGSSLPAVPFGPLPPPVDIQVGGEGHVMHGAAIVGSWNTNPSNPSMGVTFYRLADGKLAVQNKKGRWKVWKPKKPIVLYAAGASNLKTMLKADKALNKQAKRIAAMLNRRAPRKRTPTPAAPGPIILGNSARVVDV